MLPNNPPAPLSLTPDLPTYTQARSFIKAIHGVSYETYRRMFRQIWDQVGNPQAVVDWSDPNHWIDQRLQGDECVVARKIWRDTNQVVNPRYTRGCHYFADKHGLLRVNQAGNFEITPAGQTFQHTAESDQTAEIDRKEGILTILQIVREHSPGRRSDILPQYAAFCTAHTTYQSSFVHSTSLYERLLNLRDRGLVERSNNMYAITDSGAAYLDRYAALIAGRTITNELTRLQEKAQTLNKSARQQLLDHLKQMDPYKFEQLVKYLLEAMDYNNVQVTRRAHDGGVDVVADIELGISSIREVVQVKRYAGVINRPVLDQLRGVLHNFRALRGTIITTGKFAAGAKRAAVEQGGAPLTLIDGERLLDLMMQHEIGLSKKEITYYEFDDSKLQQFNDQPSLLTDGDNG